MGKKGNYKKGPWDQHLDGLLDITACCSVAHEELSVAELLDHEMDRHQEQGYRYLRLIHREQDSKDVQAWAEAALNHFAEAERLEALIECHVRNGDDKVIGCREISLQLTPLADEQRRADSPVEKLGLTIPEAAKMIGIGRTAAREQLISGAIPGLMKIGRRRVVSRSVLTAWMAGQQRNGVQAA